MRHAGPIGVAEEALPKKQRELAQADRRQLASEDKSRMASLLNPNITAGRPSLRNVPEPSGPR